MWNPESKGFIGIRDKFGSRYLFTEYHWDHDPYVGTAQPVEELGEVPELIGICEAFYNDTPHQPRWEQNLQLFRILEPYDAEEERRRNA